MSQIICKNVSLGYEGKVVTEQLNFEVHNGEYLCIVGENGVGKSTLMKALLGLQAPIKGMISTGDGFSAKEIGYLPQQTVIQKDFPASVWEIVLSGCLIRCGMRPFYRKEEKKFATSIMEKLAIENLKKRCYRELSGGQQQRVLLARALCAAKQALLLDEPAAGLDPKAAAEMYDIIERLNREEGITIIMVSHDIEAAIKYATHILHVDHVPKFFGKKEEYMRSGKGFWHEGGDRNE